jgi:hypothetical protein
MAETDEYFHKKLRGKIGPYDVGNFRLQLSVRIVVAFEEV